MVHFLSGTKSIFHNTESPTINYLDSVEPILEYFKDIPVIGVDTETEGRDCHTKKIISLQLGDSVNQYFIDCRSIDILQFKELLESNNKTFIFHNAKFDYKFLKAHNIIVENIYDTMLAEAVLYCGHIKYGYGLKDLVKRYCNVELEKETRGEFFLLKDRPLTFSQIMYGAKDVMYLHDIFNKQIAKINEEELAYVVNLENNVVKALADIEYNGIYLNQERWLENALEYERQAFQYELQLDDIITSDPILSKKIVAHKQLDMFSEVTRSTTVNYSSPLQILKIARMLYPEVEDTSDRTLTKLAKKHKFFEVLQNYRECQTIVDRYGSSFTSYINPHTNRVHTDFWQILNTGRVSSGGDDGPNLQNIPAKNNFRNCFVARPGFMWVSIDYSSQELRLMADGSGEEGFINVLNSGEDLHCYAGSMMFKRTITKADKDLRNKAKTINFGKPYGMGPNKLADTLEIPLEEAEELFSIYAQQFPKLNAWLDSQAKRGVENGYSLTFSPCNRKRYYPEVNRYNELRIKQKTQKLSTEEWKEMMKIRGQIERNSMNMPIQGTGADICKEALVEIRNLIKDYNNTHKSEVAYLVCTVHDAIDCEVREDLAQEFADKMAKLMIDCGNKYVSKVNMEVDVTITTEWCK